MNPASKENAWKSPITQSGFDDLKKSRTLQLLAEKERFFDVNDRLPQVLCHYDASRRNFMWSRSRQTGEDELIGIDWAFTGIGALGNDLGQLFATSLFFFEYNLTDMETLEAALLEGYLTGVSDNGVKVDAQLVRLGYLISLSLWMGLMLPGWAAVMLPQDSGVNVEAMYGHTAEDVLAGWVQLHEFCLNRADEARSLIWQIGL
jgi:thiamine kinase-like enzyme